jgi:large subunit ribosomal protein L25
MLKLDAKSRDSYGKDLESARKAGDLPAVFYGRKDEATTIFVNAKDFKRVLKEAGESSIISLKTPAGDKDVLIKEVSFHPASGEPIHVDFYAIEQNKTLEVEVPLIFEGMSLAVKELGGTLVKVIHELPIEALPKNLPHDITVDISALTALDSQILVKDLKLPAGVELRIDADEVVAAITVAKEEEVVAEPIDISAIEVEKKGKKEEEEIPAE